MRTAQVLLVGFLLLAASILLGRLFEAEYQSARLTARVGFVLIWLTLTLFNMWVGVTKAGYMVAEELPIFFMLLGVPAAVALGLPGSMPTAHHPKG
jgi:hypothetical protein